MTICFKKLWKLLIDKDMSKTDLRLATGMSTNTMMKLVKNQNVNTKHLLKICSVLDCSLCDIVEFVK